MNSTLSDNVEGVLTGCCLLAGGVANHMVRGVVIPLDQIMWGEAASILMEVYCVLCLRGDL